jgi:hypothetical protein
MVEEVSNILINNNAVKNGIPFTTSTNSASENPTRRKTNSNLVKVVEDGTLAHQLEKEVATGLEVY